MTPLETRKEVILTYGIFNSKAKIRNFSFGKAHHFKQFFLLKRGLK